MIKPGKMRWGGHVAIIDQRKEYRIFQGKSEGEKPVGRPRRRRTIIVRWNIERWSGMGWIGVAQDMD
jgi:hypothetical protein